MADFINTIDVLGDDAVIDSIIDRTITEFRDNVITQLSDQAFLGCKSLVTVDLPFVTKSCNFRECTALERINMPLVTDTARDAFYGCTSLREIKLPYIKLIISTDGMFGKCTNLRKADFTQLKELYSLNTHFRDCVSLVALIIRNESTICIFPAVGNTFGNTPIAKGTGYIYVPKALLSDDDATKDYRRATNWSTFASQFRALEDYTVDGTVTGELDETKI